MSVSYSMRRKNSATDRTERKGSYDDLSVLLGHLDALGVRLETISVGVDGTMIVTLSGRVRDDQIEHLGLVR